MIITFIGFISGLLPGTTLPAAEVGITGEGKTAAAASEAALVTGASVVR